MTLNTKKAVTKDLGTYEQYKFCSIDSHQLFFSISSLVSQLPQELIETIFYLIRLGISFTKKNLV